MPALSVWIRNVVIGAALVAVKALLALVAHPTDRAAQQTAAILVLAGIVAGSCFTALTPLRRASTLGRYVSWVLVIYVILGVVILMGARGGDDLFLNSLRTPWGLTFWLGTGLVMGAFCARVEGRWSKGNFR